MRRLEGYQRGINLGGWLSQGSHEKQHLDTFITKEDIDLIASWGADHVRLPLDFENVETEAGEERVDGYTYIDNCIEWCKENHLNLVLDLHKTYGYIFDDPAYSAGFFTNEALINRLYALWDKLSARYAKYEDMMMFEILNEVVSHEVVEEWNAIALNCIKVIRKNAPKVKILYGGVGHNAVTSIKLLSKPYDENIVYNFHNYEPLIFTHQTAWWVEDMPLDFHINYPGDLQEYLEISKTMKGAMNGALSDKNLKLTAFGPTFFEEMFRDAIEAAEKLDVPLYCGEYGVIDQAPPKDTVVWFHDINTVFKKYGIGRAVWTYKEKDFGIAGSHYDEVREDLLKSIFS